MSSFAIMRLHSELTTMMLHAQTVVNLRLMGMSGVIPTPDGENARMFEEKPTAWLDAWAAGTHALIDGQQPHEIMSAGMAPLNSKVRANRKRLMA